jgi:hypothetical protein
MKVKYIKVKHPSNQDCLRYCKDYETCTLRECDMRKCIKEGEIVMLSGRRCNELDYGMKMKLYRERREIYDNGGDFRRKRLI